MYNMLLDRMTLFSTLLCLCLYCSIKAAPCTVNWNCPCPELVNGCYTCPCHDNSTQPVSTVSPKCPYVDFVDCPTSCVILNNITQCFECNCTATSTAQLVCYNCNTVSSPDLCKTIKQCGQQELCHTRTIGAPTEQRFEFSCLQKSACDHLPSGSIVGRRAAECNKCCSSNLCNRKVCP